MTSVRWREMADTNIADNDPWGGMTIRARIQDWLHEREIRRLGRGYIEANAAGDRAKAVHFWAAQCAAINARSPAQVARMERKKGLA